MSSTRLGGYLDLCYWGFKLVLNYKLDQAFTGVKVTYDEPVLISLSGSLCLLRYQGGAPTNPLILSLNLFEIASRMVFKLCA
jgi:hypothetical protein